MDVPIEKFIYNSFESDGCLLILMCIRYVNRINLSLFKFISLIGGSYYEENLLYRLL